MSIEKMSDLYKEENEKEIQEQDEVRKQEENEKEIQEKIQEEIRKKMKEIETKSSGQKLIDPQKPAGRLMQIECTKCGNIDKPQKWDARLFFGIAFLFTTLSFFGLLIYFVFTNPYICKKCGERNRLVKILNDVRKIPIQCMSKKAFTGESIFFLVISFLILVMYIM